MAVQDFFTWGEGGAKLTPEQLAQRRLVLKALKDKEGDTSPVQHWTQGLARVADALGNNFEESRLGKAETELGDYNKTLISDAFSAVNPTAQTSAAIPASGASAEMAATSPNMQSYRDAIAGIESAGSGDYAAIGPTNDKLGRALGRYQIMEANIGPWSQAALGRAVTPDEFMSDPKLQDTIFDHQFGQYVQKYGPEGAAQAWLGGEGGVGQVGRKDVLGTSIGEYGNRFTSALGGSPQAAIEAISPTQGGSLSDEVAAFEQTPAYSEQFPGQEPAQQPAMPAQQPTAVQQVAQVLPAAGQAQQAVPGMSEALLRAISDPRATPQTRAVVQALMQQEQAKQAQAAEQQQWMARQQYEQQARQNDPATQLDMQYKQAQLDALKGKPTEPAEVQTLRIRAQEAGLQPGTPEYQQFMTSGGKQADSITINNGEGNKFYNKLDEKNAEVFSGLSETGITARSNLAMVDRLGEVLSTSPQGAEAAIKRAAGEFGIPTEGLDSIQAATALINRLVPQQRQPGSGTMSDADLELFKGSLPRIINQPGGNEAIIQDLKAISEYQVSMGAIADQVADRALTPEQGREEIRKLPNPLQNFLDRKRTKELDDQDEGWSEVDGIRIRKKAK